ncbi:MAG: phosphoglucosamine mutase, partial [Lysobacterales bacterium]|jgi:phosphoglucosamine mutase
MVDSGGKVVNGDELLYVVARSRQEDGLLHGGVVGTVMSNLGMELALKEQGIPFERAPVGDRYVHRALVDKGWTIGGEASGHLLFLDRASTGDGIVSALQVLEVIVGKGRALAELTADIQRLPQTMINVPVKDRAHDLGDSAAIREAVAAAEARLGDAGRVILRPSGTEPLIRVTMEGMDGDLVERLANELAEVVRSELGA